GRSVNVGGYRYGFNGKENDNEVKGEGNQQDYGMRVYDTRLGRFLSVDPITKQYPELTPYQFGSNSPIFNIDLDGLEGTSWWYRFLTDPANTLMTGTTWDDLNAAAGDINNQVPATSIINGTIQAATGRNPSNLQQSASRMDGLGQAVIGSIFHISAVHASTPPVNSAATLEKQMAENAAAKMNKATTRVHETASEYEQTTAGGNAAAAKNIRGLVYGDAGVVAKKYKAALDGDLSTAAELRVSKMLKGEGKIVYIKDDMAGMKNGTGTFDFEVYSWEIAPRNVDVKRISAFKEMAKMLKKGVNQVGAGGEVIVVRPADAQGTYAQYIDFINIFKPDKPVSIRVVNEADLPKLND
ncbi:RHS repeat protein, partial [Niastella yeongjuensis]